jgi:hypothetical protein
VGYCCLPTSGGATARRRTRTLRWALIAVVVLTACSSSSSSAPSVAPSAKASASGDVCASLQALAGSIQALTSVQPLQVGAQGVQAAIDQVETDLQPVSAAASSQLGTQVQALENALKPLKDTITGASGQSPAAVAGELQSELPAVQSAWSDLQAAAGSLNCNLATATAS